MRVGSPLFSVQSDLFSEHSWLAAILDEIPVGIGIFDRAGRLCHANRRFAETASTTSSTNAAARTWRAFDLNGNPLGLDDEPAAQVAREGGTLLPIHSQTVAVGEGGTVIVERLQPDRASDTGQINASDRFKCFAENSSNAIMITNVRTGKIEYLSPAARRIWADHAPVATLADWEIAIHPDDRPLALERRRLVRQGLYQRFQYRIVDRRGNIARHVRETSFPMPSDAGELECIGAIVEDISPEMPIYLVQASSAATSAVLEGLYDIAYRVTTFSSQHDLAKVADVLNPGCVIIDLLDATPKSTTLMELLHLRPAELQVVLIGPAETQPIDVIDALRAGAADYLVNPVTSESLARALQKARAALADSLTPKNDSGQELRHHLTSLPRREREVFLGLVGGGTNKSIARKLQLSPRTVEVYRSNLMQRLNVRTLTELLHYAHDAGVRGSL